MRRPCLEHGQGHVLLQNISSLVLNDLEAKWIQWYQYPMESNGMNPSCHSDAMHPVVPKRAPSVPGQGTKGFPFLFCCLCSPACQSPHTWRETTTQPRKVVTSRKPGLPPRANHQCQRLSSEEPKQHNLEINRQLEQMLHDDTRCVTALRVQSLMASSSFNCLRKFVYVYEASGLCHCRCWSIGRHWSLKVEGRNQESIASVLNRKI